MLQQSSAVSSRQSSVSVRYHFPHWTSGTRRVFPSSRGRILLRENPRSSGLEIHFPWALGLNSAAQAKNILFLGVAGGTIERSCYYPHYESDYERGYQATLPQGRTAAGGCKSRHGRDDRKLGRSFSGLRHPSN